MHDSQSNSVLYVAPAVVTLLMFFTTSNLSADMVNVIVETDMTLDVDDVGALAVVHALADRNEARLLGVSFNEVHPDGVQGIAAINAWYDRDESPIGRFNGTLEEPDESRYLGYLAHMISETTLVQADDAMHFYEEVLSAQPDQSVTIISLGFLNNLADLLRTHPTLIEKKYCNS